MGATSQSPEGRTPEATVADGGGITFGHDTLGQLAYHVHWSAALAAAGRGEEAAPHTILAGTLLDVLGGEPLRAAAAAFDLPEVVDDRSSATAKGHRAVAVQLGLQLVAHFTSDGRHDLADVYQEVTRRIAATT
ncbi:MAG: hypothetical protein AAB131_19610 [Actinomycetota bacterium]|mgnify:FL=1|jgi:hypothetical protein|nr:MAG: hypothetical protein FD127_1696 [Acidimicrobiaceae bacterium]